MPPPPPPASSGFQYPHPPSSVPHPDALAAPPDYYPWSDPFDYDFLLINQRVFSVAERYDVLDAQENPRFHVHRSLRFGGMALAGLARTIFFIIGLIMVYRMVLSGQFLVALVILWALGPLSEIFFLMLAPFRHVHLFAADWGEERPILSISQDTKVSLRKRFTLFDDEGHPVAWFEKPQWTNFYRRCWRAFTLDGQLICEIREDTWPRSIARRILGNPFGLLRTDFLFRDAQGVLLGAYRRRWTLRDRYILDLTSDAARRLDRRVALAAGILLDTGERR